MYTTHDSGFGSSFPALNLLSKEVVVKKREVCPSIGGGPAATVESFVKLFFDISNTLPTISVVDIPSVRGMLLYLPASLAVAYTSLPSTIHGSSP